MKIKLFKRKKRGRKKMPTDRIPCTVENFIKVAKGEVGILP
jgi:hypothetical protein